MTVSDLTFTRKKRTLLHMNYLETPTNLKTTHLVRVASTSSKWFIHPDFLFTVHPRTNTYKINETGTPLQKTNQERSEAGVIGSLPGPFPGPTRADLPVQHSPDSPNRLNANLGHSDRKSYPIGLWGRKLGRGNLVTGSPIAQPTNHPQIAQTRQPSLQNRRINPQCQSTASTHKAQSPRPSALKRTEQDSGLLGRSLPGHTQTQTLYPPASLSMSVSVVLAYPPRSVSLNQPTTGGKSQ